VASAASWAALGQTIDGVALGSLALKGKRDPVEAWSVTGATASA
jgi:class 3 adenylate cyclase